MAHDSHGEDRDRPRCAALVAAMSVGLVTCAGCADPAIADADGENADVTNVFDGGAASDAGDSGDDATRADSSMADTDAPDAADAAEATDGKDCLNPLYPPRSDGCPCEPQVLCSVADIGKTCDYFPFCPSSPGSRLTCTWLSPSETGFPSETGAPYAGWETKSIACPGDDAGP